MIKKKEDSPVNTKDAFSTKLDFELIKRLKHLSVDVDRPLNALIEEAIVLLLEKYKR